MVVISANQFEAHAALFLQICKNRPKRAQKSYVRLDQPDITYTEAIKWDFEASKVSLHLLRTKLQQYQVQNIFSQVHISPEPYAWHGP